jgi:hypothetical protein
MPSFRTLTETLARRTTRRGLFDRGAGIATGALLGAAAGGLARSRRVAAQHNINHTACFFPPGPTAVPCPCDACFATGVCAKPCVFYTIGYASGCWVTFNNQIGRNATCCDCTCNGHGGVVQCGCGSDHHNNPAFCPNGNASGPLK